MTERKFGTEPTRPMEVAQRLFQQWAVAVEEWLVPAEELEPGRPARPQRVASSPTRARETLYSRSQGKISAEPSACLAPAEQVGHWPELQRA